MRIAFVSPFYKPHIGGIERFIETLGRGLTESKGAKVRVITTSATYRHRLNETGEAFSHDGEVEIVRLRSRIRDPHTYFSPISVGLWLPGLQAAIADFDPDIVHLTNGGWYLPNLEASLAASGRISGISPFHHTLRPTPGNLPQYVVNAALFRRMRFVHAVTQSEARAVEHAYRLQRGRLSVVPLGVPPVGAEGLPRFGERDIILHVGRISRYKRSMLVAQAFAEVADRLAPELKLVLVGEDGGELEAMMRVLSGAALAKRVEFHPRVSDAELAALYKRSRGLMLPSRDESFGFVLYEALSFGCPVLAPPLPALTELLSGGVAWVSGTGARAWGEALVRLTADEPEWTRLSTEGRTLIETRFSAERMVERFLEIYGAAGAPSRAAVPAP